MIALFESISRFFGRPSNPYALRFGAVDENGTPLVIGSVEMDAAERITSQPILPTIYTRATDEIDPWGPDNVPLSPRGNPLRDSSGHPLV